MDCRAQAILAINSRTVVSVSAKYTFMSGGSGRGWRRGGAPSWYDGEWLAGRESSMMPWRIKVAVGMAVTAKNYVVLKEHVWELQRVLGGKQSSLRKTCKDPGGGGRQGVAIR